MAVAALSTSAIALATAPAAAPAPAMSETPEAFAKLVSRAKPDGQEAQGETAPQLGEGESETAETTVTETKAADAEGEAKPVAERPVDLIAELEALFAMAGQIGINVPAPVVTPTATIPTPIETTPEAAPVVAAQTATTVAPFAVPTGLPIATPAPVALFSAEQPVMADPPIDPAVITGQASPSAAPETTDGATEAAANTTLRRDIAAIVASLKAAFHPAETVGEIPAAPATRISTPQATPVPDADAASVVMPFVQPRQATAALPPAAVAAEAATPAPIMGAAATEQAVASVVTAEIPARKASSPVVAQAEQPTPDRIAPAVTNDLPDVAIPVAHADAPAQDGAEQPAAVAAPAIAPAPLAAAPVIPAVVTPASWNAAPVADAATAAAPSQADQAVARHLDLARDTQWLDQLARDISQSVTQQNHMKFQLNPEHLGALTVEIAHSAAGTAIKLSAETDQARAIIADAQPRLLAEVRAQGVRVAESHVELNQQGSGGSAFAQGQQRQSSEDSKPFVRTQTVNRDDAGDSAPRDDGELYA